MLEYYTRGTVEISGQEYPAEVAYEMDEGGVLIHAVTALREVAKSGEVWYDRDGEPHFGPKWLKLDVTDWTDLNEWRGEVSAHIDYINGLYCRQTKEAT